MRSRISVLVAALAVLAAACGSSDRPTGVANADQLVTATSSSDGSGGDVASLDGVAVTTTTGGEVDAEEALLAFAACMRDQGVEMADPEIGADGNLRLDFRGLAQGDLDREAIQVARAECADLMEGVAQRFQPQDRTAIEDQLLAYASCMRDNGVDMPDPDFSSAPTPGQGGGGPFASLDREDPTFVAANEICLAEFGGDLPFRPGGRGPGGGQGGGA